MTMNRKIYDRGASASAVLTSLMSGNAVDAKAVTSATKSIALAGAKLDNQIHGTAVACIYLAMSVAEGGPATGAAPAVALMNAMPKGSRAKALAAWFAAFSNVRLKLENGVWAGGVLAATLKSYAVPRPDEAMAKPFWSVDEAEGDPAAYNFGKAVAALLAKATKNLETMSPADKTALLALTKAAAPVLPKVAA